jgi:hypothetical protein
MAELILIQAFFQTALLALKCGEGKSKDEDLILFGYLRW